MDNNQCSLKSGLLGFVAWPIGRRYAVSMGLKLSEYNSVLGSTYTVGIGKPGYLHVQKQYYDEYSYLSLGTNMAKYAGFVKN